jgi:hypothetical protein
MKVNIVNSLVAAAFSALIAYGCYALCDYKEVQLLVTIAAFVQFLVLGLGTMAVSLPEGRSTVMFRILSGVFFGIAVISNLTFACFNFNVPLYIILNGVVLLIYILSALGIARAKQA